MKKKNHSIIYSAKCALGYLYGFRRFRIGNPDYRWRSRGLDKKKNTTKRIKWQMANNIASDSVHVEHY